MSCFHKNAKKCVTIRKKWEDIRTFDVLVEQNIDDMGSYTKYYRLLKTNKKSGWISYCNRDGEMGFGAPWERLPRNKISRHVLVPDAPLLLTDKP